ncbi:hypothetical protein PFISCL1PPCAC_5239, partial [Pristionchus fissidentatus]
TGGSDGINHRFRHCSADRTFPVVHVISNETSLNITNTSGIRAIRVHSEQIVVIETAVPQLIRICRNIRHNSCSDRRSSGRYRSRYS